MPIGAALPKVAATKGYGAEVRLEGHTVDESLAAAHRFAAATGAVLVHPFDHVDVMAGQGTVGLEILEQVPDVRTVLVCTGGGGLLGGVAAAVKGLRPDVAVVGVQAHGAAAWPVSLAEGTPVTLPSMRTIADGIAVGRPGDVTFAQVAALVDDILTVGEDALSRALLHCLERAKLVVEPAGAAGVAALMEHPAPVRHPGGRGAVRRQRRPPRAAPRDPARHGGRGALPHAAGAPRRRPRRVGGAAHPGGRPRRQRAGRGALAHVGGPARWARSTCACPWRRAARSTAPSWWRPSRPRATPWWTKRGPEGAP